MIQAILAELLVIAHFSFILFVVFGGFLLIRWPRIVWIHLPAALWGVLVELNGWICPLTPLENRFRSLAGQEGYQGDFVSRYLLPVIYPENLDYGRQMVLAGIAVMINCVTYFIVLRKRGAADEPACKE